MKPISNPLKFVSIIVMLAFMGQECAMAAPGLLSPIASPQSSVGALDLGRVIQSPELLEVASEFASLKEFHSGFNQKLIVLIEDAHANYSGQMNLAKTLDGLMSKYPIEQVLVEGGSGDVTLTPLRQITTPKIWNQVAKKFLLEAKLSGEEYLNLTSEHPMQLLGIEDDVLYKQALHHYAALVDSRKDSLKYLHRIQIAIQKIKNQSFPKNLLQYEDFKSAHMDDSNQQIDKLIELAQDAKVSLSGFVALGALKALKVIEAQIDFNQANQEQAKLMQALGQNMHPSAFSALNALSPKSTHSREASYAFMSQLFENAIKYRLDMADYKMLMQYSQYLNQSLRLDLGQTLNETKTLEDAVYRANLTTENQLKLRQVDQFAQTLRKAYNVQMDSNDFADYDAFLQQVPIYAWIAFLNRQLLDLNSFDEVIAYEEGLEESTLVINQFYESVGQRDNQFIRHTQAYLNNSQAAFMIVGGYHTQNLTHLLRQAGYSYAVLTPNVDHQTDHNLYESILLSELPNMPPPNEQSNPSILDTQKDSLALDAQLDSSLRGARQQQRGNLRENNTPDPHRLLRSARNDDPGATIRTETLATSPRLTQLLQDISRLSLNFDPSSLASIRGTLIQQVTDSRLTFKLEVDDQLSITKASRMTDRAGELLLENYAAAGHDYNWIRLLLTESQPNQLYRNIDFLSDTLRMNVENLLQGLAETLQVMEKWYRERKPAFRSSGFDIEIDEYSLDLHEMLTVGKWDARTKDFEHFAENMDAKLFNGSMDYLMPIVRLVWFDGQGNLRSQRDRDNFIQYFLGVNATRMAADEARKLAEQEERIRQKLDYALIQIAEKGVAERFDLGRGLEQWALDPFKHDHVGADTVTKERLFDEMHAMLMLYLHHFTRMDDEPDASIRWYNPRTQLKPQLSNQVKHTELFVATEDVPLLDDFERMFKTKAFKNKGYTLIQTHTAHRSPILKTATLGKDARPMSITMFEISKKGKPLTATHQKILERIIQDRSNERKRIRENAIELKGVSSSAFSFPTGEIVVRKGLTGDVGEFVHNIIPKRLRDSNDPDDFIEIRAIVREDKAKFAQIIDAMIHDALNTISDKFNELRISTHQWSEAEASYLIKLKEHTLKKVKSQSTERKDRFRLSALSIARDIIASDFEQADDFDLTGEQLMFIYDEIRTPLRKHFYLIDSDDDKESESTKRLVDHEIAAMNRAFSKVVDVGPAGLPKEIQGLKGMMDVSKMAIEMAINGNDFLALLASQTKYIPNFDKENYRGHDLTLIVQEAKDHLLSAQFAAYIISQLLIDASLNIPMNKRFAPDLDGVFRSILAELDKQAAYGDIALEHEPEEEIQVDDMVLLARHLDAFTLHRLASQGRIRAIVTDEGNEASHLFIVAKEAGIPIIILDHDPTRNFDILDQELAGRRVIIDGSNGKVIINPTQAQIDIFARLRADAKKVELVAKQDAFLKSETIRKTSIPVSVNADRPDAIRKAMRFGAEGVGLVRTEYMVVGAQFNQYVKAYQALKDNSQATADELLHAQQSVEDTAELLIEYFADKFLSIAEATADGKKALIRMYDLERDKADDQIPNDEDKYGPDYYQTPFGQALLEIELRGAIRAQQRSSRNNIEIMFPMFRDKPDFEPLLVDGKDTMDVMIDDANFVMNVFKEATDKERQLLESDGGALKPVEFKFMVENEYMVMVDGKFNDKLLRYILVNLGASGLSIGTNDLTRSLENASRDKREDGYKFSSLQPKVVQAIKFIYETVDAINDARINAGEKIATCSICGQSAGWFRTALLADSLQLKHTPVNLSVVADDVHLLRWFIRQITPDDSDEIIQLISDGRFDQIDSMGRSIAQKILKRTIESDAFKKAVKALTIDPTTPIRQVRYQLVPGTRQQKVNQLQTLMTALQEDLGLDTLELKVRIGRAGLSKERWVTLKDVGGHISTQGLNAKWGTFKRNKRVILEFQGPPEVVARAREYLESSKVLINPKGISTSARMTATEKSDSNFKAFVKTMWRWGVNIGLHSVGVVGFLTALVYGAKVVGPIIRMEQVTQLDTLIAFGALFVAINSIIYLYSPLDFSESAQTTPNWADVVRAFEAWWNNELPRNAEAPQSSQPSEVLVAEDEDELANGLLANLGASVARLIENIESSPRATTARRIVAKVLNNAPRLKNLLETSGGTVAAFKASGVSEALRNVDQIVEDRTIGLEIFRDAARFFEREGDLYPLFADPIFTLSADRATGNRNLLKALSENKSFLEEKYEQFLNSLGALRDIDTAVFALAQPEKNTLQASSEELRPYLNELINLLDEVSDETKVIAESELQQGVGTQPGLININLIRTYLESRKVMNFFIGERITGFIDEFIKERDFVQELADGSIYIAEEYQTYLDHLNDLKKDLAFNAKFINELLNQLNPNPGEARMSDSDQILEAVKKASEEFERLFPDVKGSSSPNSTFQINAIQKTYNGFDYVSHGTHVITFEHDDYPGLVFKVPKSNFPEYAYYKALVNFEFAKLLHPGTSVIIVDGVELDYVPGIAPSIYRGGVLVQEKVDIARIEPSIEYIPFLDLIKQLARYWIFWTEPGIQGNSGYREDGKLVVTDIIDREFYIRPEGLRLLLAQNKYPSETYSTETTLWKQSLKELELDDFPDGVQTLYLPTIAYYRALKGGLSKEEAVKRAIRASRDYLVYMESQRLDRAAPSRMTGTGINTDGDLESLKKTFGVHWESALRFLAGDDVRFLEEDLYTITYSENTIDATKKIEEPVDEGESSVSASVNKSLLSFRFTHKKVAQSANEFVIKRFVNNGDTLPIAFNASILPTVLAESKIIDDYYVRRFGPNQANSLVLVYPNQIILLQAVVYGIPLDNQPEFGRRSDFDFSDLGRELARAHNQGILLNGLINPDGEIDFANIYLDPRSETSDDGLTEVFFRDFGLAKKVDPDSELLENEYNLIATIIEKGKWRDEFNVEWVSAFQQAYNQARERSRMTNWDSNVNEGLALFQDTFGAAEWKRALGFMLRRVALSPNPKEYVNGYDERSLSKRRDIMKQVTSDGSLTVFAQNYLGRLSHLISDRNLKNKESIVKRFTFESNVTGDASDAFLALVSPRVKHEAAIVNAYYKRRFGAGDSALVLEYPNQIVLIQDVQEGRSWTDHIRMGRLVDPSRSLEEIFESKDFAALGREVARMHNQGIIHKDLTKDDEDGLNFDHIFYDDGDPNNPEVFFVDFGLAERVKEDSPLFLKQFNDIIKAIKFESKNNWSFWNEFVTAYGSERRASRLASWDTKLVPADGWTANDHELVRQLATGINPAPLNTAYVLGTDDGTLSFSTQGNAGMTTITQLNYPDSELVGAATWSVNRYATPRRNIEFKIPSPNMNRDNLFGVSAEARVLREEEARVRGLERLLKRQAQSAIGSTVKHIGLTLNLDNFEFADRDNLEPSTFYIENITAIQDALNLIQDQYGIQVDINLVSNNSLLIDKAKAIGLEHKELGPELRTMQLSDMDSLNEDLLGEGRGYVSLKQPKQSELNDRDLMPVLPIRSTIYLAVLLATSTERIQPNDDIVRRAKSIVNTDSAAFDADYLNALRDGELTKELRKKARDFAIGAITIIPYGEFMSFMRRNLATVGSAA